MRKAPSATKLKRGSQIADGTSDHAGEGKSKKAKQIGRQFFAFLRAVNVGGSGMINMKSLQAILSDAPLSFKKVKTILQSGNVAFRCIDNALTVENLRDQMEQQIEERSGVRTTVMLRTADELRNVMRENPFVVEELGGTAKPNQVLVMFLTKPPTEEGLKALKALAQPPDAFRAGTGAHLFFNHPNGIGESKLARTNFEKVLGCPGTARNWNTLKKLLALEE